MSSMDLWTLAVETGDTIRKGPIIAVIAAVVVLVALFVLPKVFKKNDTDPKE